MADYNLAQLSSRSFEHLIQALAIKVIGSGLVVFGDGPDGGREATFQGKIPYPTRIAGWDGYCVIQAKFRQRPTNDRKDREWALSELKKEMDKYLSPDSDRRRPDYFIFATNVTLTPVNKTGTKDRALSMLEDLKRRLPLKGFDIWDYDKIRVFLDADHEVRQSYSAWITPGDVLAAIIRQLNLQQPDFKETMYNFLQKQLLSDQFVNLEQAGNDVDERIPLARVFIDLHTTDQPADPDAHEFHHGNEEEYDYEESDSEDRGFVSRILDIAGDRLDRRSLSVSGIGEDTDNQLAQRSRGRFVLIGGPGQGKTTVAQFICQVFRASILARVPAKSLAPETCDALSLIRLHCKEDEIEMSVVPRFPFRIVLNEFATALSSTSLPQVNSVLSYLAHQIERTADQATTPNDLRNWLSEYPTMIVFDGLDEVPSSSNRDQVLTAIRDFWVDASSANADILALATSRPQGYNDDFSSANYHHEQLAPLSKALCSRFARRLARVRYGSQTDRKRKVLSRLHRALESESTSRLMRSPLQVTIMTALVDRLGQPPQARWNLFKAYYDVIYQREVERDILASAILREYQPDINAIHSRVGLLLQVDSEQTGRTDTRFSQDRFIALVTKRLEEEGHRDHNLRALTQQIVDAALERLVFLVGLESDQVGFEIRSLQEFMAAESLMEGSDSNVHRRLHEIGPLSNWRNVFLFAAGKCFSDRQHLRDTIHSICMLLNERDGTDIQAFCLSGSGLAMDLLDDGLARHQPKFIRSFARVAIRSLDVDHESYHIQLAQVYDEQLKDIYTENLNSRLTDERLRIRLNAWSCLLNLVATGVGWAEDLARQYWPEEVNQQATILEACRSFGRCNWATDKLLSLVPVASFDRLRGILTMGVPYAADRIYRPLSSKDDPDEKERYTRALIKTLMGDPFHPRRQVSIFNQTYLGFSSCHRAGDDSLWSKDLQRIPSTENAHPTWEMVRSAARFLQNPTRHVLARELAAIASAVRHQPDRLTFRWHWQLPWPLAACLNMCTTYSEIMVMSRRAQLGELGDINDWMKAEDRWEKNSVKASDLLEMTDDRLPFDSKIAYTGFPTTLSLSPIIHANSDARPLLAELLQLRKEMQPGKSKSFVSAMIVTVMTGQSFSYINRGNQSQPIVDICSLEIILSELSPDTTVPIEVVISQLGESARHEDIERLFRAMKESDIQFTAYRGPRAASEAGVKALSKTFSLASKRESQQALLFGLALSAERGQQPCRDLIFPMPGAFDDPDDKISAIVVSVSGASLDEERTAILTESIGSLGASSLSSACDRFISTLENSDARDRELEHFLVSFGKLLPVDDYKIHRRYLSLLQRELRSRTSAFCDPIECRKLNMPRGITELL